MIKTIVCITLFKSLLSPGNRLNPSKVIDNANITFTALFIIWMMASNTLVIALCCHTASPSFTSYLCKFNWYFYHLWINKITTCIFWWTKQWCSTSGWRLDRNMCYVTTQDHSHEAELGHKKTYVNWSAFLFLELSLSKYNYPWIISTFKAK